MVPRDLRELSGLLREGVDVRVVPFDDQEILAALPEGGEGRFLTSIGVVDLFLGWGHAKEAHGEDPSSVQERFAAMDGKGRIDLLTVVTDVLTQCRDDERPGSSLEDAIARASISTNTGRQTYVGRTRRRTRPLIRRRVLLPIRLTRHLKGSNRTCARVRSTAATRQPASSHARACACDASFAHHARCRLAETGRPPTSAPIASKSISTS